jgi:hypothetical protein
LVRPRRGSQSAGLIIWFERSGGRGFDKDLFREPRPRHFATDSLGGIDFQRVHLLPELGLNASKKQKAGRNLLDRGWKLPFTDP